MKHRFQIGIDGSGIDDFIKGIEEYKAWLKDRMELLLKRLADEGYAIAAAGFQRASYAGTNDSAVSIEDRGDKIKAVVAVGSAVLFIEFGTGINFPDIHPEAAQNGMIRGEYGQGKGKNVTWDYYGEPGTSGQIVRVTERGQLVMTYGSPANMPMYNAVKQLKERLPQLVKEVFGGD